MADKYQVFISFKNLDEDGNPTADRVLAQEVYTFLAEKGLRVFLSTVTLQALGVAAYKKAIDDALDSSSAVVVVGTSAENLDSPWVRYEWDSYFNDILTGVRPSGRVFSFVKDIPTRELPRPLRQTTSILHGPGAMARLYQFVTNALGVGTDVLGIETPVLTISKEALSPKPQAPEIFLSYPRQKADWVRHNLYDPLTSSRGTGKVFFDAHETDPDAGWLGQVADALERSSVFIPVYCPDYFNSKMCLWELHKAVARDPVGAKGTIIPIMLEKGVIPYLVSHIQYLEVGRADFQGKLFAALERLLPGLTNRCT